MSLLYATLASVTSRNPAFEGVPYHERWSIAAEAECVLDIVVLTEDSDRGFIASGSGIVVAPHWRDGLPDGRLPEAESALVYYEGWIHGANQYADLPALDRWKAGVFHAAGRAVTEYPTTASALLPTSHLRVVGRYHTARGETDDAVVITDTAAVDEWLSGRTPGPTPGTPAGP